MPKIPKRISFFWTGRMSWLRYLTLWSFRKLNPAWQINLYYTEGFAAARNWQRKTTDSDVGYTGPDYFSKLKNIGINLIQQPATGEHPAHQCDLFQWNLLSQHAGYFADMDILWLKPLDEVQERYAESDAVLCLEGGYNAIGFLGSSGCQIFMDIAKANLALPKTPDYQQYGTLAMTRAFNVANGRGEGARVVQAMQKRYPALTVTVAPDKTVYPFLWTQADQLFDNLAAVSAASYGLHWFGGCAFARKWANIITEDNWQKYNNTFTACLTKILQ